MKNRFSIALIVLATLTFSLNSCEKLKEKLFTAFITNSAEEEFIINVITTTNAKTEIGLIRQTMNLDSIIKAETSNAFSLDDISSINMEEVKVTILNPDTDNNFANFEEGWLEFNTNFNTTPILVASGLNPDVYAESWLLPVDKAINLKEYLKGNHLAYILQAKARRVTTKPLECKLAIKFKVN